MLFMKLWLFNTMIIKNIHKLQGYLCLLVQTSNKTWQTIAILAFLCWPLEYCLRMAKQYLTRMTMPLKTSQRVGSLINYQLLSIQFDFFSNLILHIPCYPILMSYFHFRKTGSLQSECRLH